MRVLSLENQKMFAKFLAVILVPIVTTIIFTFAFLIPNSEEDLLEAKKSDLKNLVDIAYKEINAHLDELNKGKLASLEEAKFEAAKQIEELAYGENGYFFVYDNEHKVVAYRPDPSQKGVDKENVQDPDGNYVIRDMVNLASSKGEGYYTYKWLKPGTSRNAEKISYFKYFPEWGWTIGTGVYTEDLQDELSEVKSDLISKMLLFLFFVTILSIVFGLNIAKSVSGKVNRVVELMKKYEEGDLQERIDIHTKDEIGFLSTSIDNFLDKLRDALKEIIENGKNINHASGNLEYVSNNLFGKMEQVKEMASSVAAGTEQMAANVSNMAATAEEMSINAENVANGANEMNENTNNVATAVEEMSMSINDVTNNAQEASLVASKAKEMSDSATHTMETLGEAANEIGKVTEVIKRIAEQTNLLALNATIEAASAGEAGKGFAVVANEIKELANQSAKAAEDIANKINGVQTNTKEAVKVIGDVSEIINKINSSVEVITKAVEQQAQAAGDIANSITLSQNTIGNIVANIQEVAQGSADLAKNSSEAAEATNDVANNIHIVNESTEETAQEASKVKEASQELASIAENLEKIVSSFKI